MARTEKNYGETVSMTTTAAHLAVPQGYTEVEFQANNEFRLGYAPALLHVLYYLASGTSYTEYTAQARDKSSSTHVPLDAMATGDMLYMDFSKPTRGAYYDMGTNVNANAATLDVEYVYDASDGTYQKLTGTVSGALTVGETVTGQTSGVTATLVYSGATYIVVKSVSGVFLIGEDVDGASQTCDDLTAIEREPEGNPYFTDVAGDSDGTDSGGATLAQDGLYSWTLPAIVKSKVDGIYGNWIRFKPSATLSATVDIVQIIPACADTNYGYYHAGEPNAEIINATEVGAIETDMDSGSATLYVTWKQT